ncbi:nucleotidyltransferase domain-containing protein [Candidatus Margulisiibacteriota bacterium]
MDYKDPKVRKKIKCFLDEFKKVAPMERAIVFGSYARGRAKKWSDIDLAIVSKRFEGISRFRRLVLLGKLAWKAKSTEIEAIGFTPKEYKTVNKYDLLHEIKENGITIYKNGRS